MKTVIINGSPKKSGSVSGYLAGLLCRAAGGTAVQEHVRSKADHSRVLAALRDADAAVFVMPLYLDGVPSHLLAFMKVMEDFCRETGIMLRIYALSNSGFIEGRQNAASLQVIERFCRRSGHTWCGGLGIGGGVMLNVMRYVMLSFLGLFAVNVFVSGAGEALSVLLWQAVAMLVLHAGVLAYGIPFALAIHRGQSCRTRCTRIMLPAAVFILIANTFFTVISLFGGGLFRGWLAKK